MFLLLVIPIGYLFYRLWKLEKKLEIENQLQENKKNNQTLWGRIYGND